MIPGIHPRQVRMMLMIYRDVSHCDPPNMEKTHEVSANAALQEHANGREEEGKAVRRDELTGGLRKGCARATYITCAKSQLST
jgi:hypothetical protein